MTDWDKRFLHLAKEIAAWSKDPSTKVGAVIVRPDKTIASVGYNGFPRGVEDRHDRLMHRDEKLLFTVHAEQNAILSAREPLHRYTIYVSEFHPCASCAASIVQSGISCVVHAGDTPDRWRENVAAAKTMFKEAGVVVRNIGGSRKEKAEMTPCYIFDLDGTIADCSHRLHHIEKQPKNWKAFFSESNRDKPIPHTVDLLKRLHMSGAHIVFVSGRSEECRLITELWLQEHAIKRPLYMRKKNDRRDDSDVKIEMLAEIRADGFEPIMVFDDRNRVVKAWRAAGIPCAQVAEGDF